MSPVPQERCRCGARVWRAGDVCKRCRGELRAADAQGPSLRELREANQARLRREAEARRQQQIDTIATSSEHPDWDANPLRQGDE